MSTMAMVRNEKETERDKERERDRVRQKDKDKEKVRLKENDRISETRERVRDHERDKQRDQEQEKVQERDTKKEREKKKDKERFKKGKEKEKERERAKEREKDRENDREKERDRDHRIKERDRDTECDEENYVEREKEKDRQRSNAKQKERDNDRDRNKDREESNREREKDREHVVEKEKADDKYQTSKERNGSHSSPSDLAERIAKVREERRKATAEHGSSLTKADADVDIQAWVNKSRKIEHKKKLDEKEKAARMAKILAEQDHREDGDSSSYDLTNSGYGGKDLAGLKVSHGFGKVMEGHAVVLTLRDVSVLDGDDINKAIDELENIEMAQQQAREDAYNAAKKNPGSYEDKFDNDMESFVRRTGLSKYDAILKDEGLVINASGGAHEDTRKKLEEVRLRLEGAASKESLSGTAKVVSDYFTEEEMLQFKKPKKKKKLRKKENTVIDELEAEAVAAGLGSVDMGSRDSEGRRAQKEAAEKIEAEARKNAYQHALNKAESASRFLLVENIAKTIEAGGAKLSASVEGADEDLYSYLDMNYQTALKTGRCSGNTGRASQSIVTRLAALEQQTVLSSHMHGGSEVQEGNLVFTDTGEFCRTLQLDDAVVRRSGAKDVFGEEDEVALAQETKEDPLKVAGGWTEVVEFSKKSLLYEEEIDGGDPVEEPIAEVSVGKGLASALSLLKERGTLKEAVDWGGRNMDKKRSKLVGIVDESNNQVGQRDILLDRVDEFGRTMTPKEAFRKLSHKFHGKGPGKMKQEKKMKQFQEELRLKQMNSGDTPLMSMEKMREAQARMHTPYLVISGHIKPGQTSDPRSGFATVEKESVGSLTPMLGDKDVGSLTPMLGDKKVEHFLGIRRKAESGSMGPPPAKQPKLEH